MTTETITEVYAVPSERDMSASITAVAMGEMDHAMDLIASCIGITHQRRQDGSCRCGRYAPTVYVRRVA
jgi:hypothetical protein